MIEESSLLVKYNQLVLSHFSYLLRMLGGKKQAWQDLCTAMDIYDEEVKKES